MPGCVSQVSPSIQKLTFDKSVVDPLQLSEENEVVGIIWGGVYVGALVRSSAIRE